MYKTIILPLAKEDIRDAAIWYNKKQVGLGKRFTTEVREKVHFIRQNPKAVNIRYNDVRAVVLNVFPFMVHYTINEDIKTVVITAILHTSRNPEIWKKR